VLLRLTTRIAHASSIVELSERQARPVKGYEKQISRTVILPSFAKLRHFDLQKRLARLKAYAEATPWNRIEPGETELGIICDGVAYQYAREVFPKASFLKLALVFPFPDGLVRRFAETVAQIVVIEEGDRFLELQTRALGIKVTGKDPLPRVDELSPGVVRHALTKTEGRPEPEPDLPNRPPALCPGCPHTGIFYALQKEKLIIGGDIGCYTLGALPPHNAMDTCIDMGASITFAHGADKALGPNDPRTRVAVIGDSTFFHSGITGLINVAYNRSNVITIITDNRTTGMTGHQPHPGTGKTLMGEETVAVDIESLARACGIRNVVTVDPYQVKETRKRVKEMLAQPGPAVIVSRRPCVLLIPGKAVPKRVDPKKCNGCRTCIRLGCPAIMMDRDQALIIDTLCVGCGMCADICPKGAIS